MNQRAIVGTVVVFVLLIIGMFVFAYLKSAELTLETNNQLLTDTSNLTSRYADIKRIDAKHFFIDGVHTFVGEVTLPTPCDLLESAAEVRQSAPPQLTINFTVINNAETCTEQLTNARFMTNTTTSEDAVISARFQGRAVELNLIEAAPGETPANFELFIKG